MRELENVVPKSLAVSMALVVSLAGCWSDPPPEEDPLASEPVPAKLDIDEYFTLAVGAPSDLHVHLRQGYRELEPITVVEARCSEHCFATVRPDGVIRVVAHEEGEATLDVTARRASGEIVSDAFRHRAAPHDFDIVFDRQSSPGAADGVVAGDAVTWFSVLNLGEGGIHSPELELADLDSANVEVTRGSALVRTAKMKAPERDVLRRQHDVTARSGILDGPAIGERLSLTNEEELMVVLRDAAGREGIGGRPEVKLDIGSVVLVDAYSNGHLSVLTRSIGVSTIYLHLGAASTSVLVEVR